MKTPADIRLAIVGLQLAVAFHERDGEHEYALSKAAMLLALQWAMGEQQNYLDDVVEALSLHEAIANN